MAVPARFLLLLAGLLGYGLSLRLMIAARVGVAPWEVFHLGLSGRSGLHGQGGLSVGQVSILVGLALLAYTRLKLGERLGIGTLLNVLLIGLFLDALAPLVHTPGTLAGRWAQFLLGLGLLGLATGAYVGAGLGAGPRDGLMLGLHRVYGWPVARIRTVVELVVLAAGTALGGPLGWGTVVFALLAGPSMAWGLRLFGVGKGTK